MTIAPFWSSTVLELMSFWLYIGLLFSGLWRAMEFTPDTFLDYFIIQHHIDYLEESSIPVKPSPKSCLDIISKKFSISVEHFWSPYAKSIPFDSFLSGGQVLCSHFTVTLEGNSESFLGSVLYFQIRTETINVWLDLQFDLIFLPFFVKEDMSKT